MCTLKKKGPITTSLQYSLNAKNWAQIPWLSIKLFSKKSAVTSEAERWGPGRCPPTVLVTVLQSLSWLTALPCLQHIPSFKNTYHSGAFWDLHRTYLKKKTKRPFYCFKRAWGLHPESISRPHSASWIWSWGKERGLVRGAPAPRGPRSNPTLPWMGGNETHRTPQPRGWSWGAGAGGRKDNWLAQTISTPLASKSLKLHQEESAQGHHNDKGLHRWLFSSNHKPLPFTAFSFVLHCPWSFLLFLSGVC